MNSDIKDIFNFRQGKLFGVHAMKVSTMKETFIDTSFQIIIFYCGPLDDKGYIMEIGHNLLEHIEYANPDGAMFFKPDSRTFLRKPKPTGNKNFFKYSIDVPRHLKSKGNNTRNLF